ncbi:MAG: hypothetical protein R6U32_05910 [Candidatus Woesearchaeota archaeon]
MRTRRLIPMIYVISVIAILTILSGCGNGNTVVTPDSEGDDQQAETGAQDSTASYDSGSSAEGDSQDSASEEASDVSMELSADERNLAEERLDKGERVALSTPYKIMEIGDSYVFAVGIKNIYPNTKRFRLDLEIEDAKTSGLSNLIHTDETIYNWFSRNTFSTFTLDDSEEKIVPLIVEVGPYVAEGEETVPGSYTFDITFEYETSDGFWDNYNTGQDLLTIKVK